MVNMTLAVPQELKKKMDAIPEMNWSEVARQAFRDKVKALNILKRFAADSTLTEEDALRLGKKVSKAMSDRLRKMAKERS